RGSIRHQLGADCDFRKDQDSPSSRVAGRLIATEKVSAPWIRDFSVSVRELLYRSIHKGCDHFATGYLEQRRTLTIRQLESYGVGEHVERPDLRVRNQDCIPLSHEDHTLRRDRKRPGVVDLEFGPVMIECPRALPM